MPGRQLPHERRLGVVRAAKSAELLPKSVREQRTVNLAQAVRRLSDCGHRELAPDSATGRVGVGQALERIQGGRVADS